MKNELRKVVVILDEYRMSETSKGYFHQWVLGGSVADDIRSYGIIELEDGTVKLVRPFYVQFVDEFPEPIGQNMKTTPRLT